MKKSTLFKKSVLILILALILGLFVGCTIIIPDNGLTGTVYILIPVHSWAYYIYLDGYPNLLGTTNYNGSATFYNVPTGYHTFFAEDVDGWYSGIKTQNIHTGSNYVNIQVN
jgi:hypothetical protein